MIEAIRVSADSRPTAVAGALAELVRNQERAEVQAIGANAVNQALKATAIARSYLRAEGIDFAMFPGFTKVMVGDQERTALRLTLVPVSSRYELGNDVEVLCEFGSANGQLLWSRS